MRNQLHDELATARQAVLAAQQKLKDLEKVVAIPVATSAEREYASVLHFMCRHRNHADDCPFYHEEWENPGYSRIQWVEKSRALLAVGVTVEMIEPVVDIINPHRA